MLPGHNWNIPTKEIYVFGLLKNLFDTQICDPSLGPVLHFNIAHNPGKWRQVENCEELFESRDLNGWVRRLRLIKQAAEESSMSLSHCKALSEVVSDQNNRKRCNATPFWNFDKLSNLSVFVTRAAKSGAGVYPFTVFLVPDKLDLRN